MPMTTAKKAVRYPTAANRRLAWTRAFFNWAVAEDVIESSPAARVKAPAKEIERERVLTDNELRKIWSACDDQAPFGALVKLLLLTALASDDFFELRSVVAKMACRCSA